ncbi:hypothetical protein P3S67_000429 [Capsicum chacoense]
MIKKERGRPKKQTNTDEEPTAKRGKERPRKAPVLSVSIDFATPLNYRGRATHAEPVPSVGTDFAPPPNYRGGATHAKPSTTPKVPPHNAKVSSRTKSGRGRGRGSGYPLESWFTCSQGSTTHDASNFAPREIVVATRGRQKGVGNTSQYKRPRMTEMGVFQAENGFTTINPGLPSRRIVSTGPKQVMKSAVLSRDIGFKPSSGLKWKGKQTITTRRLQ